MDSMNASVIILLCSHLSKSDFIKPFEPLEWTVFAEKLIENDLQPEDLIKPNGDDVFRKLNLDSNLIERIDRLLNRGASLSFDLQRLRDFGIKIITRADAQYPRLLKSRLGKSSPPLFYYMGDLSLAANKYFGVVGSRTITEKDNTFARVTIHAITQAGYGVVSGGAKGVDLIARNCALENGEKYIEFVSDSMIKKAKDVALISAIQNKQALIFSASNPDAGFHAGLAMMRNKYIYTQSEAVVVIKSDYNKGGTWSGAIEGLRNNWVPLYCWDNKDYIGNQALIIKGAQTIDETWKVDSSIGVLRTEQLSLIDH